MKERPDGALVLTWREAHALVEHYADAGKFAVAAWMRRKLADLAEDGYGDGDEVEMAFKPDAEVAN